MGCAHLFESMLQQPLSTTSCQQFQELLDPVNSCSLGDDDLHSMICSMTSALERLNLTQQDTTSLSLHMDLYARVLAAGASRAHASIQSCDDQAGWAGKPIYQAVVMMLSQGVTAFSQALGSHDYMVPSVLPCLISLSQPVKLVAAFTFFTPRLVMVMGSEQFNEASLAVRNAVKDLASIACSVITAQANAAASSPEAQQEILMCQQATESITQVLLSIGQQIADIVSQPSTSMPKEQRSFAVLNMAWTSVAKLLTSIPQQWRAIIPDKGLLVHVLQCVLRNMGAELEHASNVQYDTNRLQVIRFWLQLVAKVSGAYPRAAAGAWQQLLDTSLAVYKLIHTSANVQLSQDVYDHVAPKLVAALLVVLSAEAEDFLTESLAAKVQQLAASAACEQADAAQLLARVALVTALLLRSQAMQQQGQLRLLAAEHLLPWLMKTTCIQLYDQVLSQDMGPGSLWANTLQACLTLLICCHASAAGLEDPSQQQVGQQAWSCCQLQLYLLAAQQHPLMQHMACELLCALVANGEPAFVEQQLRGMCALVKVVAAVESLAMEAASSAAVDGLAKGLSYVLGRLLQVAPAQLRSQLLQEHLSEEALQQASSSLPGTAAAVVLADAMCGASCSEMPSHQLDQMMLDWCTQSQQVFQLSREGQWSQAEQQLQQQHLAWLLEGIAVAAKHSKQRMAAEAAAKAAAPRGAGFNQSSDALATCAVQAADIITAAAGQHQSAQAVAPYAPAALHILAHTGELLSPQAMSSIVPALIQLQAQPSCAAHIAAICAYLAPVQPPPVALFHAALLDPHWATSNAAMESLVVFARTCSGDFRSMIPPQLFGSKELQQQFVTKLKGFMQRQLWQPELLLQEQQAPALLQQEGQQLRSLCAAGAGHQGLLARAAAGLQLLDKLVTDAAAEPMQVDGAAQLAPTHPVAVALADSRSQAAAVLQSISSLERSVRCVEAAVLGSMGREDVHMLSSATSALLGDLASMSSKIRGLQDVVHAVRGGH